MKIDVDNPRWLDIIRMSNLVLNGIVTAIRISSGGEGLHLYSSESYFEPIECPERFRYRRVNSCEITFNRKNNKHASSWIEPDLIGLLNMVNEVS